ncbi:MAG: ATP-binding protein [bacterium]|nr:ATP-binding protein [bacterium]
MAQGRLLRQLIRAGAETGGEEFRVVAEKVIEQERLKKHHLLANDLERILYGTSANGGGEKSLSRALPPIPVDAERKLPLMETQEPVRSFEDLVLSAENQSVLEQTILEQGRRDVLGSWGLRPNSRLLFCGPPGCGKTLAAEVLAAELGLALVVIRFDAVVSSFLGATAANLRKVFDFLEQARCVALFDEFDAIAKEREDATEHGELRRVVSAFLQMLDHYRGSSVLVAASNHEGMLDRALWRRFDEVVFFETPDEEGVKRILEVKLRGVRRDFEVEGGALVDALLGLSGADIERVLIRAIKDMALSGREFVGTAHIMAALARERRRRELSERPTG